MTRWLRRFHRDEDAAVAPLLLFIGLALAYMLVLVMNTSQSLHEKTRLQNTADSVAITHADWTARSLNVMSMNNVAITQMHAIMVTSTAWVATAAVLEVKAAAVVVKIAGSYGRCSRLRFWPAVIACYAYLVGQQSGAAAVGAMVIKSELEYKSIATAKKSFELLRALDKMNDDLFDSFPQRAGGAAAFLTAKNSADNFVFHPPCEQGLATSCRATRGAREGSDLPIYRPSQMADIAKAFSSGGPLAAAAAVREMCIAGLKGSEGQARQNYAAHGFEKGSGPYGGGGADGKPLPDHVNEASEIDAALVFFDGIFYFRDRSTALDLAWELDEHLKDPWKIFTTPALVTGAAVTAVNIALNWSFFGKVIIRYLGGRTGEDSPRYAPVDVSRFMYDDAQKWDDNAYTTMAANLWKLTCGSAGQDLPDDATRADQIGGALLVLGQPFIREFLKIGRPYWLKGRSLVGEFLPLGRDYFNEPNAWSVLAIVQSEPGYRVLDAKFQDGIPAIYAYSEALAVNLESFDLYTQTWQATLLPSRHMNKVSKVLETLEGRAAELPFRSLTRLLRQSGGSDEVFRDINNH